MLVGLCRWIHPVSGHRCVLGLVHLLNLTCTFVMLLEKLILNLFVCTRILEAQYNLSYERIRKKVFV